MEVKSLLLLALVCASYAHAASDGNATTATPETTSPAPTTTPAPPTTPTTSTTSSTTASPEPTTSTTSAPPTTVQPPTTPAPAPSDERGNWTVSGVNGTCIMAQMVLSAKVLYPLKTANQNSTAVLNVPSKATATGTCGENSQSLVISWAGNNINISFEKNDTTKGYYVSHIALFVVADEKIFPNASAEWLNSTKTYESSSLEFQTQLSQSYRCSREETLPLTLASSKDGAVVVFNKVQLQAFREKAEVGFGDAHDCEPDTPDIVPIAVGCALAVLVFVVLVAYLVGRRRSQSRGYLSIFLE